MDDSLNTTKDSGEKPISDESMLETSSALSDSCIQDTSHNNYTTDSDIEPMDISKTTVESSDSHSDCSSPSDKKYFCPICDITLISQHEFTLHIRSHNNDNEIISDKGFTCRICSKVLSSSSSLDRHVLVHSGERPFKCKLCAVTFTTNGNMHRHMRTHSQKMGEQSYESDGSTDSNTSANSMKTRKRRLEFNNNLEHGNNNKRKLDFCDEDDNNRRKRNFNNNNINEVQKYHCPVCDRDDFSSLIVLETHLEDNHPEYEVKCVSCNLSFKNPRALNVHRIKTHNSEQINNINNKTHLGFKDLTFVDFSSNKFPTIARYECEKNLHKPITNQKFQCEKCFLAFPCSSALQMHQDECLKSTQHATDLTRKSSDEEIRRDNFFAHLDLQNKTPPTSPKPEEKQELRSIKPAIDSKDLADIQSIISMTSNESLLQHLRSKPSDVLSLPQEIIRTPEPNHHEEETQDVFAAEFRKMKLRGEFPCRLCTAVFPNLRALKGHNRAHLNGNGNSGPYRCNMCPHSSIDKAALIRHMRTHNGDRPYECSLCNYAFTTKANCERHLRNRHAKVTREEVKKSIIYHPSEDPTNDEINKLTQTRDMKPNFDDDLFPDKLNSSISKEKLTPHILPQALGIQIPPTLIPKELARTLPKEHSPLLSIKSDLILRHHLPKEEKLIPFPKPSFPIYKPEEEPEPKLKVKTCFDGLKQIPDYDTEDEESQNLSTYEDYQKEHPIDLSMDVLDLSKKKETQKEMEEEPQDFTKKTLESNPLTTNAAQLLFAQQLLKNRFYANPLSQFYQHSAIFGNPPLHPYQLLFPPPFMNASQELKERMLSLKLGGGTMISDQFMNPNGLHHPPLIPDLKYSKTEDELKPPLHINTQLNDSVGKLQSPKQKTPELSHSPGAVKMVIKNGVLMPKQKQRRYRTERPFSCEHCSARFTLRSNMERHIKQQHPQFWSQRQRTGLSTSGRKPSTPPSQTQTKPPFYELNVPNYDIHNPPKLQDLNETKDNPNLISQHVKYAILAQKLKSQCANSPTLPKDEDEDALVIDEENDDPKSEAKDLSKPEEMKYKSFDEKMLELRQMREKEMKVLENGASMFKTKSEEHGQDLVPVARLLDNAVSSQLPFREYFRRDGEEIEVEGVSEEEEEGLVASGSTSEGNGSGSDENKSENEAAPNTEQGKKKSAYSLAPNRVSCPYCHRKFPWTSSLRRHVLTHTGQKPFKCPQCPLLFTTKSNCDRHLLRKHGNTVTNESSLNHNNNNNNNNNNNQNYMMRNVPERPFKCSNCPSSTFSTLSNLKKHMSCKHTEKMDENSVRDYESFASSEDERKSDHKSDWETQISQSKIASEPQGSNSDLPFKCHLCECSYSDRQEALDHIRDNHVTEFELLMAKGALDQNPQEDSYSHPQELEDDDNLRGKFPDYANRKVMCAFCMRRFWSAEDLRRHMRTHTGERPFSCDICNRRFTLKHSMLRHRKKHNLNSVMADENVLVSGDEEYKKNGKSEEDSGPEGSDLIGNLLGIRDKSIIDQVLVSSADDAAKLLGVNSGQE